MPDHTDGEEHQTTEVDSLLEGASEDFNVFISYRTHPDEKLAVAVRKLLESSMDPAPRVFVASSGGIVPSNIGFNHQIARAARKAKAFIGIFTEASKAREWVFFEAGAAWGRDALYAPLVVKLGMSELPSTVSGYQAIRGDDENGVLRLVTEVASRIGSAPKSHFAQRYVALQRVVEAYPGDPETTKPTLDTMIELLVDNQYGPAEEVCQKLMDEADDNKEKAKIRAIWIAFNDTLDPSQKLRHFNNIPTEWQKDCPEFYYLRSQIEARPFRKMQLLHKYLELGGGNEHLVREVTETLARHMASTGSQDLALAQLSPLLRSDLPEDRTVGASTLRELLTELTAPQRLLLDVLALGGSPGGSTFRSFCDFARSQEWHHLHVATAHRYDSEISTGTAANQLGLALDAIDLDNLAYAAYARAAEAGISVSRVNMANLLSLRALAWPGLQLLKAHREEFDAAERSYPYSKRAALEKLIQTESETLEQYVEAGEKQYKLLLDVADLAVSCEDENFTPATIDGNKVTWSGGTMEVELDGKSLKFSRFPVSPGTLLAFENGTLYAIVNGQDEARLAFVDVGGATSLCGMKWVRCTFEPTLVDSKQKKEASDASG